MDWARMLAYVTGTVDQELLSRNEYLAAENLSLLKNVFVGNRATADDELQFLVRRIEPRARLRRYGGRASDAKAFEQGRSWKMARRRNRCAFTAAPRG